MYGCSIERVRSFIQSGVVRIVVVAVFVIVTRRSGSSTVCYVTLDTHGVEVKV